MPLMLVFFTALVLFVISVFLWVHDKNILAGACLVIAAMIGGIIGCATADYDAKPTSVAYSNIWISNRDVFYYDETGKICEFTGDNRLAALPSLHKVRISTTASHYVLGIKMPKRDRTDLVCNSADPSYVKEKTEELATWIP